MIQYQLKHGHTVLSQLESRSSVVELRQVLRISAESADIHDQHVLLAT